MQRSGQFTVLEGIDGCGKTSVARGIANLDVATVGSSAEVRPAHELVFVSRRTVGQMDDFSENLMRQTANMLWCSGDGTTLSPAFWVTLQASWFTALTETVITPLLTRGHSIVVDGWYYKFWSKLLDQGYTLTELETIFSGARRPDNVILLNPDVGATFDRGREFRPSELGMHAGFGDLGRRSFVDYQTRGLRHLESFADRWKWHIVDVADHESTDVTVQRTRQILDSLTVEQDAVAR